jgi:hypothetical protein
MWGNSYVDKAYWKGVARMTKNKLTGERFNVWDIDGTIFLEDHEKGSYHIGETGNVDINCLNDIANRLNDLSEENEQLKQRITELEKEVNNLSCGEADWLIEEEL